MKIQNKAKDFFSGACYAYCIAFMYGSKKDIPTLTKYVCDAWANGYIDDDGYVNNPLTFANSIYTKGQFKSVIKDTLPSSGIYIVQYVFGDMSHFVVYDFGNKKIVFDPYENSNTVLKGKQLTIRRFA